MMSREAPEPLIEPAERPLWPDALAPVPDELEPELMLLPLPIFAFFRTKPPPAPAVLDALLDVLLELLLSRCRQPVAVICPAVSLEERPVAWLPCEPEVVGWLLCGVDEVGACAASVPHRATLLHSVTAHCQ